MQEQIGAIVWTVYNKIRSVTRTAGSTKSDLEFKYDAMGQRMVKIAKPRASGSASTQEFWTYTYYVRDAQGNVMATYERKLPKTASTYKDELRLKEQHLYGSSRAGMRQLDLLLTSKSYNFSAYNGLLLNGSNTGQTSNPASQTSFTRTVGQKVYEMANHLGNVLVTVTDGRVVLNSGAVVTGYNAVVRSASDYSAFGAPLEGRKHFTPNYRYGFNGMEKDAEMHGNDGDSYDFGARMYDARVGRWLSRDPEFKRYPSFSSYCSFANNPLVFVDPDGRVLKVSFDNEAERLQAQATLQKLTNDKVEVLSDGTVKLTESNQNPNKNLSNGTQLLRDVSEHKRLTTIVVENSPRGSTEEATNKTNSENGTGSDAIINLSNTNGFAQVSDGTKTMEEKQPEHIVLGNELIHALIAMDGNSVSLKRQGSHTYKNIYGKRRTEFQSVEELAVHVLNSGFSIDTKGKRAKYITENDLRKEQGLKLRVAYEPAGAKTSPYNSGN